MGTTQLGRTGAAGVGEAAWNSLVIALASTVLATIIGTLAAFALTRFKFRGRSAYSTLIFISLVMPEIVMAISCLSGESIVPIT